MQNICNKLKAYGNFGLIGSVSNCCQSHCIINSRFAVMQKRFDSKSVWTRGFISDAFIC
jgi:hypothetical protein